MITPSESDEDATTPESLTAVGKKVGLTDAQIAGLIKSSSDKAVKDKLAQLTQEALDLGAFGAPIIVFLDAKQKKQMIFGSDRMELIASMLGEKYEGPLNELSASKL